MANDPSDLHVNILIAAPYSPSDDLIIRQLSLLSDKIDRLNQPHQINERNYLCGQYQALMWARSPAAFAPPVEV